MPEPQRQPGAWLAQLLDAGTRERCFEPAYFDLLEEHLCEPAGSPAPAARRRKQAFISVCFCWWRNA